MPNLFPYTNTHELNLDWILQVVKDFQTKYTTFDQALADALAAIESGKVEALDEISTDLTAALNDIEASQTAALTAIGNTKDSALADIGTALTNATNAISALNTTVQGEITTLKNTSISEITTAQGSAISAITASMNHATTIIEQLYNTLPASAQDILGKLDLLDNIITGNTPASFTWLQGSYIYPEGETPPTPPAIYTESPTYNQLVSSRYMTGVGGRRIRIITDGTIYMTSILTWRNTPPGGGAGGYVPGQASWFTNTYADILLPLDVTAFSIEISKPNPADTIAPTDIPGHIEIQWITDFVSQRIIAPKESSTTADVARLTGEYFFLDGDLYIATDDIDVGDTIAEHTNCEKKTVGGELSELKSANAEFKSLQPNLFWRDSVNMIDKAWLTNGKRIGSDGNVTDLATACTTVDYIEIPANTKPYLAMYFTTSAGAPSRTYAYMAFYNENKTFIAYYSAGTSSTMTNSFVAIPSNAKYFRVTFGVRTDNTTNKFMVIATGTNDASEIIDYVPYMHELTVVPSDLNRKMAVYDENGNILKQLTGDMLTNYDIAERVITRLNGSYTFNQNDITIVKDELWCSKQNPADFSNGTGIFRYKMVNGNLTLIGTINCDFGHLNVMDYNETNDCLIFGNSANSTETTGNYFCVVPNPTALGPSALISNVAIKYDVDVGYKVNALWYGDNFGQNNIVLLLSNDLQTITKLMLNRDANGNFDGTYTTLDQVNNLPAFGIQGADIWGDKLYVGGQYDDNAYYAIKIISLSDYTDSKLIKRKMYKSDGTAYSGTVQGITITQNHVWVFCNSDAPQTGVCCFLTQYRR